MSETVAEAPAAPKLPLALFGRDGLLRRLDGTDDVIVAGPRQIIGIDPGLSAHVGFARATLVAHAPESVVREFINTTPPDEYHTFSDRHPVRLTAWLDSTADLPIMSVRYDDPAAGDFTHLVQGVHQLVATWPPMGRSHTTVIIEKQYNIPGRANSVGQRLMQVELAIHSALWHLWGVTADPVAPKSVKAFYAKTAFAGLKGHSEYKGAAVRWLAGKLGCGAQRTYSDHIADAAMFIDMYIQRRFAQIPEHWKRDYPDRTRWIDGPPPDALVIR